MCDMEKKLIIKVEDGGVWTLGFIIGMCYVSRI